ncbi:hypothetical protein G6F50_017506 [Rhizopus delemar]|uniref:Uncharacterized protein n=1 Tax=Rhizopus delemar TaxID=936053 RepID=A0A9P6XQF1_9FUNG|nr:hypothetical protein G6F50_017506 [Rhizopus delemar]
MPFPARGRSARRHRGGPTAAIQTPACCHARSCRHAGSGDRPGRGGAPPVPRHRNRRCRSGPAHACCRRSAGSACRPASHRRGRPCPADGRRLHPGAAAAAGRRSHAPGLPRSGCRACRHSP